MGDSVCCTPVNFLAANRLDSKLCVGRKPSLWYMQNHGEVECAGFHHGRWREGGTGAAPPEFSNHVGMPMLDALATVDNCLRAVLAFATKMRLIASGKVLTGFHMIRHGAGR